MGKEFIKRQLQSFVFFLGWVLSPLTIWNDSFVNIPLAYLIANFVYFITHFHFRWLFISSYIFTNILGVILMLVSGKKYIFSRESKIKALISLIVNTTIFSVIITLLDKSGILAPLSLYVSRFGRN